MGRSKAELISALTREHYPRSAKYDPAWVLENLMGPNVLWLTEALTQSMQLQPGMRVLDLGCGRAVSSVFLAKEFGIEVWAADLWIEPTDNCRRIREAGTGERVFPIHVEAHDLPFAHEFFDAIVSMDAYHYFGTDNLYLGYILKFLKPGGQLGIAVPGLIAEFDSVPDHFAPYWQGDFWSFHSPAWWRRHWQRSGLVEVTGASMVPDGWKLWLDWLDIAAEEGYRSDPSEAGMVRIDAGRNLGFASVAARKR